MDSIHKIVASLPLTRLWCSSGRCDLDRVETIGKSGVVDLLRSKAVRFVVADVGLPLRWIPTEDTFRFWKNEVSTHVIDPETLETGFPLEDYPDGYGYIASQWKSQTGDSVILLEKSH